MADLQRLERIKELMRYFGLNKSTFAGKIGVSKWTIQKILSGENRIGEKVYHGIKVAFPDVNMNYLYTGQGKLFEVSDEDKHRRIDTLVVLHDLLSEINGCKEILDLHGKQISILTKELDLLKNN